MNSANEKVCEKQMSYAQMEKNTVDSRNQLKDSKSVRFINPDGKGMRIMFAGNSITLHGVLPEIGWHNEWGMAASGKEKDYVHILMKNVEAIVPDAQFCICQVADWEREYRNGAAQYHLFENARNFEPDIIVMRFIENCPKDGFDGEIFKKEMDSLLSFLDKSQKAKIILTTGFWKHPGDQAIVEYANEKNLPCAELGDLGEAGEMKALGLFEHEGVANHPGDLGMEKIAERIWIELKKLL